MPREGRLRIAVAADHAGFDLKGRLVTWLEERAYTVLDLGARNRRPSDYPDFAEKVGRALLAGRADRGVLICGSGVGVSVAANKIRGIRAAVCHDAYSARQGVEHDDMNVLVLGSRVVGLELARELTGAFLKARFSAGERHLRRLEKVRSLERRGGDLGTDSTPRPGGA